MNGPGSIIRAEILNAYDLGKDGKIGKITSQIKNCTNPIQAFAMLAAYFAGEQETVMSDKLEEYEQKHEEYKEVLAFSKIAHEGKAGCNSDNTTRSDGSECYYDGKGFDEYMDDITEDQYSDGMDKNNDSKHEEDEWQDFIDDINKKKDMESTDLNKLSTEMDMAVKDSGEAEQMAANAIKKATELMSTQGKTAGG